MPTRLGVLSLSVLQVPLGTVVHKLVPPDSSVQGDEGEPVTFQRHWVGARDYVSSDDDSDSESSASAQSKSAHLEV